MKQLTKNLYCVLIRENIEIWVDGDKAEKLQNLLQEINENKFIRFENQTLNTADIMGVFNAKTMEEKTRRRNGGWQCSYGYWHNRGETCAHGEIEKYK